MDVSKREASQRQRGRRVVSRPPRSHRPARRPSVRQRLRYRFDNSLAHGPLALIAWLGVVVAAVIVVAAFVGHLLLRGGEGTSFLEDFWQSLIRVLDASAFESETAWPSRLVALTVTLLGVFVGGSLIGLIATALDQRVSDLGKGRSVVLESDHTLILGASARLPVIVQELVVANENRHRPAIVVLAPRPVTEIEADLRDRVGDTKNTRVVCRSGDPAKPLDLELVNVGGARSVIVLAGDEGDAAVVKTILAVKVADPDFSGATVVAEFANPEHAATIRALTEGAVSTVNSDDVIAQVTAQACHQSGLSVVFRELLDFGGDECYFAEVPELVGHTYGEALLAFRMSSVIGVLTVDHMLELNPPSSTIFEDGDQVVAVAEDDDKVTFSGFVDLSPPEPASVEGAIAHPLPVLIVGWSSFGPKVVQELQEFLAPGSEIEVCVDAGLVSVEDVQGPCPGLAVSFISAGPKRCWPSVRGGGSTRSSSSGTAPGSRPAKRTPGRC